MKITNKRLKRIIKEELSRLLLSESVNMGGHIASVKAGKLMIDGKSLYKLEADKAGAWIDVKLESVYEEAGNIVVKGSALWGARRVEKPISQNAIRQIQAGVERGDSEIIIPGATEDDPTIKLTKVA